MHATDDLVQVANHQPLGQLQLQLGRVEVPRFDQTPQVLDKTRLNKLQRADVHRQCEVLCGRLVTPARQLGAGAFDDPGT